MRRIFICLIMLSMEILFSVINVKAETTKRVCTNSEKVKLGKLAAAVDVDYALKKDSDGNYYFNISIYNISNDDIYVRYTSNSSDYEFDYVYYKNTNNGTYVFSTTNTSEIVTYKFEITSHLSSCKNYVIKTLSLVKPKRNMYHDSELCQYEIIQDYYYCQEWLTRDFLISQEKIEKNIETELEKRSKESKKTTDISKDETEEQTLTTKSKRVILIVGTIIVTILILIGIQFYRIKRYEI